MGSTCECSFDGQAFRAEFESALQAGMESMKSHSDDTEAFIGAYKALEHKLAEIVEKWKPPRELIRESKTRAIELTGSLIEGYGAVFVFYAESDLRNLCISLLRSTGGYTDAIPGLSLDMVTEDVIHHLESGGFTQKESKSLIRDLMCFSSLDMKEICGEIAREKDTRFTDFLRFLEKNGSEPLKARASVAIVSVLSSQSVPEGKVLEFRPKPKTTALAQANIKNLAVKSYP